MRNRGNSIAVIDNRRVVPYSPYFSFRYKAHINVEVCGSVKAVKYIHKYIYKGGDRATAIIDSEHDEVKRHLHGRYIGPTEAVWRLFEFHTHQELPSVTTLALHLPGQQAVYFSEREATNELRQRLDMSTTTLLAFFSITLRRKMEDSIYTRNFQSTMCINGIRDGSPDSSDSLLVGCGQQALSMVSVTTCGCFLQL